MDRYVFKYDIIPACIEAVTLEMEEEGYKLLQVVPYSVDVNGFYSYTVVYERGKDMRAQIYLSDEELKQGLENALNQFADEKHQQEKEVQVNIDGKKFKEAFIQGFTQANKDLRRFIPKK